jgi:hypothetical protein
MANNPYYNKIIKNGSTVIDLTGDDVTPADVRAGVTFHDMSGASCVGTASMGKVIASIAPASVPIAWTDVVATYETVCYDTQTADTATVRTYEVTFAGMQQTTLDPDAYGIEVVQADRPNSILTGNEPRINGISPAWLYTGIAGVLKTTTTRTATAAEKASWIAGARGASNGNCNLCHANTAASPASYTVSGTARDWASSIESNADGSITVVRMSGATQTQAAPADTSVDYQANGNEVLSSAKCISATGTPVYGPGYLVTYTDNSTETFAAAAADIADGSY